MRACVRVSVRRDCGPESGRICTLAHECGPVRPLPADSATAKARCPSAQRFRVRSRSRARAPQFRVFRVYAHMHTTTTTLYIHIYKFTRTRNVGNVHIARSPLHTRTCCVLARAHWALALAEWMYVGLCFTTTTTHIQVETRVLHADSTS